MIHRILWVSGFICLVAGGLVAYFLFTAQGSQFLTRWILARATQSAEVSIAQAKGSLAGGITLQDLAVSDPLGVQPGSMLNVDDITVHAWAPLKLGGLHIEMHNVQLQGQEGGPYVVARRVQGNPLEHVSLHDVELRGLGRLKPSSVVKIQHVRTTLPLTLEHLQTVENARLWLEGSDPVVLFASQEDGLLNGRLSTNAIDLREFLDLVAGAHVVPPLSGSLTDVDVALGGTIVSPVLRGHFLANQIRYREVMITEGPGIVDMALPVVNGRRKVVGTLALSGGTLTARQARVELRPSELVYAEDAELPTFAVDGKAKIGGTTIHIRFTGTVMEPNLKLTSEPPMPQGILLVMLATGKSWKGAETALKEARMTVDLAKDAIDYFLLGGVGTKLSRRLGIEAVSLKYEPGTKGVEIKKAVGEGLTVTYGVEQAARAEEAMETKHQVGVERPVGQNSSIQLEAEKVAQPRKNEAVGEPGKATPANDSVWLKYKKRL